MFYTLATQTDASFADAHVGLSQILLNRGSVIASLDEAEVAAKLDKMNLNAQLLAAECAKRLLNSDAKYLELAIEHYARANELNPNRPPILLNLVVLYVRNNDCAQAKKFLPLIKDFPGFSAEEQQTIQDCMRRCAE